MGILAGFLLVIFVIVALLLILMVLIQDEGGDSLGGIFAGSSNSTFGSKTGNVVTRFTGVLGTLFIIIAVGLTFVYRTGKAQVADESATTVEASVEEYDWTPGGSTGASSDASAAGTAEFRSAGDPAVPVSEAGN